MARELHLDTLNQNLRNIQFLYIRLLPIFLDQDETLKLPLVSNSLPQIIFEFSNNNLSLTSTAILLNRFL